MAFCSTHQPAEVDIHSDKDKTNVVGRGHLDQGRVYFVKENGRAPRKQNIHKILWIFVIES